MDPFDRARAHHQALKRRSQTKRTPLGVIDGNRVTKPRSKLAKTPSQRRVVTSTTSPSSAISPSKKAVATGYLPQLQRQILTILAQERHTSEVSSVCRHLCLTLDKLQRTLTPEKVDIHTVLALGRLLSKVTDSQGTEYMVDISADRLRLRSLVYVLLAPVAGIYHASVDPKADKKHDRN